MYVPADGADPRLLDQVVGEVYAAHPHPTWSTDLEGSVTSANPALLTYVGRPMDHVAGQVLDDAIHPDDLQVLRQARRADRRFELRLRRHDGQYRWFQLDRQPLISQDRNVGWVNAATDIHDLRSSHLRTSEQHALLQSVIDGSSDCIKILDLDAQLLSMNAGGMQVMEIDDFNACHLAFWPTFWEGEGRAHVEAAIDAARAGQTRTFEGTARTFKGTLRWWDVTVSPIHDADGQVRRLLAISRDISRRKRQESLTAGQSMLLERIAGGVPLTVVLHDLVRFIEAQDEGRELLCAVLRYDPDERQLFTLAAGALPDSYTSSVNGLRVGPDVGSCGAAIFRREPVATADIATDPNWTALRDRALSHGLRACWSVPILSRDGQVFGVFAVYYREARLPTPVEEQLLGVATHLAQVAFERDQLLESERRARAERDENAALIDAFFTAAPTGFGFFDTRLRFRRLNPALASMHGYPVEEHLGKDVTQLLPGVADSALGPLRHVLETREVLEDVLIVGDTPAALGETRTWSERFFPVSDAAGNLLGVGAIATDVTEQLDARRALQHSEDRFRSLVAASAQIVWTTDPIGQVVEPMPSWEVFTGVTHDELRGFGWLDTLHPDDREGTRFAWTQAVESRGHYEVEYRVRRHDGEYRMMHVRGIPVLEEDGRIREWVGSCIDITERRRAEEQVMRLAQIVEESTDFIGTATLDGQTQFLNRFGRELLGLSEADVPRTAIIDYFPPHEQQMVRDEAMPALFREGRWRRDTYFRHFQTGEVIAVDWNLFLIRDPKTGTPTGVATVTRDIRDRKQAEQELHSQAETLTTLNRINQVISGELDQDKLVQAVTDASVELTGAQFGALFYNVKNGENEAYTLYTLSGVPREAFASFPMPRNTKVFSPTFNGEGVVRVADITQDPRYAHNTPYQGMPQGHLPVRSYLAVPVISRSGEVMGGLFFGHPDVGVFSERAEQIAVGLAAQAAVALDNARLYQQLQDSHALLERRVEERTLQLAEQAASLDAFAAFTESVGTETDVYVLAQQARDTLRTRFPDASIGYYELDEQLWKLRVWTDDIRPEVLSILRAGLPMNTPVIAEALATRKPVFVDTWDAQHQQIDHTDEYGAVGNYPLVVDGEVRGFLSLGQKNVRQWTERDKAMLSAVGHGFTLALERAEQTARVEAQRDALEARTQTLEAFAQLTRNLTVEADPDELIKRAQEILMSLLTPGYTVYWEPKGDVWRGRSQVGDAGHPALQDAINAGLARGRAISLDTPWETGQPLFQDVYAQGADTPAEIIRHVRAAATLPVKVRDTLVGILGVGLFDQRQWTPLEKAVMETVARSLGLALESAESARALKERTHELERSNAELERFAYVASHDLQEPLRTIASFTELINRRYGEALDDSGRKYLSLVTRGAERMKTLIDDLLVFSRLNTIREPHQAVALDGALHEALQRLHASTERNGALITHDSLPTVQGDPTELTQLFQNLIGNAVKFRHPDRPPQVHVSATREGDFWHVQVRDNGIGFDQQYAERVFQMFQRLQLREQYEGTGMGLAIVRKIAEHHGGRVWAESQAGVGSVFHVTLPAVGGDA